VKAVEGTSAQIVDGRATTPGLRLLEKYAIELGGGRNSRFGLDDGVVITPNHIAITGDLQRAVQEAREKLGHLHKVNVYVNSDNDVKGAIASGADVLIIDASSAGEVAQLAKVAKELSSVVAIEYAGTVSLDDVRAYAEAGADLIRIDALTSSAPSKKISFNVQPY